ncbi:MAG: peptidoglycan DD-metalloendopeptidase family protein [Burkholderiales bacterium]|mgnify:CR=1 FL=1
MNGLRSRTVTALLVTLVALLLAGCSFRSTRPAPVEERGAAGQGRPAIAIPDAEPAKALPGAENAGKPGYYTVKPGDTVIRIGLDTGQNWRDVVRWNALDNPNLIEVGQVLRVTPPGTIPSDSVAVARPVTTPSVLPSATPSGAAAPAAPVVPAVPSDEDVTWIWPTSGQVVAGFDEAKNKGLDIAGKAGDAVVASGDGRVVYAGAGLRGYGNLIILKHNNTFLTAYAHNQTLLVKEDQAVRKGQKIAEMGNTDADRVKLHFEIRRQGKPVDPAKYLPAR